MFGVMVEEDVWCKRVGRNGKIIYTDEQARQQDVRMQPRTAKKKEREGTGKRDG